MKLYELTATKAIEKIRNREISIKDLIDSFILRLESLEDKAHAWAYFDKKLVYDQVNEIDDRISKDVFDGHFYGIPVGIKDIFNTKYMPTTMGSPIWKDFAPGNDSRVVHNIIMEGGIIMGKTVTAEFAVHHPGPTPNPYNPIYSPGTSSSGSAAAVATAMVPLAIGTQTAGSIIKPASYCGVYGYKPSFGLLPRTGILKTVDYLDHVGFITRSVDDLKLMLDALRVKGENYPYVRKNLENRTRQARRKNRSWKIAFVKTHAWKDAEEYTKASISRFIKSISSVKGIKISEKELPKEFDQSHDVHSVIYEKALSYYFKDECASHPELISGVFKDMVERGKSIPFDRYREGMEKQVKLTYLLDDWFKDFDAIFTISTAGEAPKMSNYMDEKRDTSLIWTMCRAPSINLPLFKSPNGMPFGIQVVARRYNDYLLLSFLKYLEKENLLDESNIVL